MASGGPYKGEGETVYATDPQQPRGSETDDDRPKNIDDGWLYHQYVVLEKNGKEIADLAGVSPTTIYQRLNEAGIDTRDKGHAQSIASNPNASYRNEDWLREQYLDREKPASEIGELSGVHKSVIYNWLRRYGIRRRSRSETWVIRNSRKKYADRDWLFDQYVVRGKSTNEIAESVGCHHETIRKWLKKHDVDIRSRSEAALLRYEQELAGYSTGEERELVGDDLTIDASWRDLGDRNFVEGVPYRDESWLRDVYDEVGNTEKIADICGVSGTTIRNWMDKFNIERAAPEGGQSRGGG